MEIQQDLVQEGNACEKSMVLRFPDGQVMRH